MRIIAGYHTAGDSVAMARVCEQCRGELTRMARFCPRCGTRVGAGAFKATLVVLAIVIVLVLATMFLFAARQTTVIIR
jgi:hypothetical protein